MDMAAWLDEMTYRLLACAENGNPGQGTTSHHPPVGGHPGSTAPARKAAAGRPRADRGRGAG